MEGTEGLEGQREKLGGEHFISDDTCVSMALAELQSATITKKQNHSSCQPALNGLCEKTLEAPFSQECLLNKIMRVNRKQMCVFSVLQHFLTSTTCEGTLIMLWKRKHEEEVEIPRWLCFLPVVNWRGMKWPHRKVELNTLDCWGLSADDLLNVCLFSSFQVSLSKTSKKIHNAFVILWLFIFSLYEYIDFIYV